MSLSFGFSVCKIKAMNNDTTPSRSQRWGNVLWKLNMMLMMLTWEGLASQFKIQKSDLLSRFQSHPRARSSATSYPLLHKSWAQAPVSVEKSPPDPSSVYLCKEPATFGPWELFVHLLPSVGPGSGPIQM